MLTALVTVVMTMVVVGAHRVPGRTASWHPFSALPHSPMRCFRRGNADLDSLFPKSYRGTPAHSSDKGPWAGPSSGCWGGSPSPSTRPSELHHWGKYGGCDKTLNLWTRLPPQPRSWNPHACTLFTQSSKTIAHELATHGGSMLTQISHATVAPPNVSGFPFHIRLVWFRSPPEG